MASTDGSADSRSVFVVQGRDQRAARAMHDFLRAIDLKPVEWSRAVAWTGEGSPYIGDVLKQGLQRAQAIIVLLTPDDLAFLRDAADDDPEGLPTGQSRPNVLFEAGMALAMDDKRTILVEIGHLRPFSDVAGRHTIRMDNSPQRRHELASRLVSAGCAVDRTGSEWFSAGDFVATADKTPRPRGERAHARVGNQLAAAGGDHIELFEAHNGTLQHRWYWDSWSSWTTMDTPEAVAAVASGSHGGWVDLFVTTISDQLWHRYWHATTGWSDWDHWGIGSPPLTTASLSDEHIEVFFMRDGELCHEWFQDGSWSGTHKL